MRTIKLFAAFIFCTALFGSCSKTADNTPEVTYEVHIINGTTWSGIYIDELGNIVSKDNMPTDWKYTFKDTHNLCCLSLGAIPDCYINCNADAVMEIYVNGKLVASGNYSTNPGGLYYTF